ncbi:hypothetical protein O3P69_004793 [Scylla paramamosain]|uniref:C2H2-type domain-containing protein n=1 Tax=Scylla paramamosain TaxID=85552 RepID=A0AAW0UCZ9_SCYPA
MSRPSDGYFGRGSRRRVSEGYGRQYGDSYGGGRSSQEYSRDRSSGGGRSQGRGLMVNPWEGGMVPGSGGMAGRALQGTAAAPDIVASINHLSRMDNPESELALNILNAVLTNKEETQWARQRDWEGGQKRRMDWDDQYYGSGRGILPTPQMPPRKLPRRDPNIGPAYSWGVVGGFVPGRPGRGRGGSTGPGYKMKKTLPAKKKIGAKEVKTSGGGGAGGGAKTEDKTKAGKVEEGKGKEPETGNGKKAEGDEGKAEADEEGTAEGEAAAVGDTAGAKSSAGDTEQKKKELEPKKKKEECPVPLSYLRCHICHMHKFNNGSNFMDHVRSKKHRRITLYYQEKIDSSLKMLKAQSWLKSQRHIVSMVKQKGRITRCDTCDCPIKGGQGPHLYLREHALVYHFTKCFTCKKRFASRAELEAHKLTFPHMKAQSIQDSIARERFLRKTRKQGKETVIPEQKLTEEFHEMVTQMQLNNLSTQVWNKDTIPVYDPATPIGLNHLVKQSLFVCAVCPKKVSQTAHEALEHCKSREHYDCYQAHLKALEEKEAKGETSDKENEKEESTDKKEATEKPEIKKEKEEEEENKDEKETDKLNEEEEEEMEIKMENEDDGMKDMDNMEVIDEEGEQEEEEEEEEQNVNKDVQEGNEEEEEMGDDVLASVEEVGEDLEEETELEEKEEEKKEEEEEKVKDTGEKTSTSATSATPEDKTGAR